MIGASICDKKEIDINSSEIKEMISNSVKEYILNNWDQYVQIEKFVELNRYVVQFSVEL